MPRWLFYTLVSAGGLFAITLIAVLTFGGLNDGQSVVPYRWREWFDNVTGDGKVIKPQADDAPPPWVAAKPEPAHDAPEKDGAEAAAVLAPIETAAVAADKAIAAYRDSRDDAKLAMAAQQAIDAMRRIPVNVKDDAATQAAVLEMRDEKATVRQHALEDARRVSRATHEVAGARADAETPYLVLRAAAHPSARDLGHLNDGDRVHVFLATGTGWARVEVLTGPATGQNGYTKDKYLQPLQRADAAK
jgi:hypothetical protein